MGSSAGTDRIQVQTFCLQPWNTESDRLYRWRRSQHTLQADQPELQLQEFQSCILLQHLHQLQHLLQSALHVLHRKPALLP